MGWKPGQGVGPRITRKEKKKQKKQNDKIKIYGCALPQSTRTKEESDSEDSDNSSEDIMFAPDDYEPFRYIVISNYSSHIIHETNCRCNPKDNYFGLGYNGLDRQPVLSAGHINLFEVPAFKMQEKNKKLSIRGQAFGVGAFEADDEDIYQRDDMSRYDFTLEPEKKKKPSRWSKNEANEKHCLEGFTPAKNTLKLKKTFPPPELPENFQPTHVVRKTRFYPPIEPPPPPQNEKKLLNRVKEIVFTSSHVTTPICEEVENPLKEAVKKKMFGKLTHEKIEWKPASIVCKRFNIPEPQSGCALPEMKKKASKFSVFDSLDWCESSKFEKATDGVLTSNQMISPHEASGLKIISNLPKPHVNSDNQSTDEKAKNFEESYEKIFGQSGQKISEIESTNEHIANSEFPEDTVEDFTIESTINNSTEKKDLFKAIFLSSSEDSESEPETNINDEEVVKSVLIGEVPLKANIQRNTSPPRGIFAQLDLDNLITPSTSGNGPENDRTNIDVEIKTESSDNATSTNTVEHCSENSTTTLLPTLMLPDMYGPVLPTTLIKTEDTGVTNAENPQSIFNNSVVSKTHHSTFSGKWVERGKVKKSKKEKKKHKHKVSSKHKRKLKKEKR